MKTVTHFTLAVSLLIFTNGAFAQDELSRQATWQSSSFKDVETQINAWSNDLKIDKVLKDKIKSVWKESPQPTTGPELLDRAIVCISIAHPEIETSLSEIRTKNRLLTAPTFPNLDNDKYTPFVQNNVKLHIGNWLANRDLYDEADKILTSVELSEVVDGASLLFYRGIGQQRLLQKEECIATLEKLLENQDSIPLRFKRVATLVLADLRPLKKNSLDEVSRLMEDIERRQGLYRSGKIVRDEEEDVLAKLEKLIDQMENPEGSDGPKEPGPPGPPQPGVPTDPADDSVLGGEKGAGEVDPKSLDTGKNWGDLPAAKKAESMADLEEGLPAHYRNVITEYLKKLADEDAVRTP